MELVLHYSVPPAAALFLLLEPPELTPPETGLAPHLPGAGAALQSISAAAPLLHKKLKLKNPETNNEFNLV